MKFDFICNVSVADQYPGLVDSAQTKYRGLRTNINCCIIFSVFMQYVLTIICLSKQKQFCWVSWMCVLLGLTQEELYS